MSAMAQQYNVDEVIKFLRSYFANTSASPAQRSAFVQQLEDFLAHPQSWNIAFDLLSSMDESIQFFGGTILVSKIAREWPRLQEQQHSQLHNYLMQQLRRFACGPVLVRTQICIAIAIVIIYCGPEQWPNFFVEMTQLAQNNLGVDTRHAYLQLMQCVAEEVVNDTRRIMTEQRKKNVAGFLKQNSVNVLQVMLALHERAENDSFKEELYKALNAWYSLDLPLGLPNLLKIVEQTVEILVNELQRPDCTLTAEIVDILASIMNGKIVDYHDSLRRIVKQILNLHDVFEASVEDDYDKSNSLCYLFAVVGETVLSKIYADQELGPAFARLMCDCTAHPAPEVAEVILQCWEELAFAADECDDNALRQLYNESVANAVEPMLKHLRIPPDYKSFSNDEVQDFQQFRSAVGDALANCTQITSFSLVFDIVYKNIVNSLNKLSIQSMRPEDYESECLALEACFTALRSITEHIPDDDNQCVVKILHTYSYLPKFPRLQQTALGLLGELSDWIALHPDSIPHVLQFIVPALAVPELTTRAARAIKDIAIACPEQIMPLISQIITPAVANLYNLHASQRCYIVQSISTILNLVSVEVAEQYIMDMLKPGINRLASLVAGQLSQETANEIGDELRVLACACYIHQEPRKVIKRSVGTATETRIPTDSSRRHVENPHPFSLTLRTIWSLIGQLFQRWRSCEAVLNGICHLYKTALCGLQRVNYLPFLKDTIESVVAWYRENPSKKLLSTFACIVVIYRTSLPYSEKAKLSPAEISRLTPQIDPEVRNAICRAFATIVQHSVTVLPTSPLPEVTAQFFELCVQIFECMPEAMGTPEVPVLQWIVNCALQIMNITPDRHACRKLFEFLAILLSQRTSNGLTPVVATVLASSLQSLILKCMQAVAGEMQRSQLENVGMIMLLMCTYYLEETRRTLQELFADANFPSPRLTRAQKDEFLIHLFQRKTPNGLNSLLDDFAIACRGLSVTVPQLKPH